ncbi:MAG: hypothetical protein GDA49_08515 [Rhodospirillales bacterium]|nr:hypothetical protein [Rhodospirillales bacterium]
MDYAAYKEIDAPAIPVIDIGPLRDGSGSLRRSSRRAATYPPQPEELGPEVFGVRTVLRQDEIGGLQVQDYAVDWVLAHPIPGTLVVDVGDLLARWSNGKFRSTPHRVINRSGCERLSLVLAFDPDYETMIDPAIACTSGETPEHNPISCGDHLVWRFGKAFAYRGEEAG